MASTDGFELAEVDLDLRGEGTIMSSAQKGRSDLRLASLRRDRELVRLAREAAFEIVDADPVLAANPVLLDELDLLLTDEDTEFLTRLTASDPSVRCHRSAAAATLSSAPGRANLGSGIVASSSRTRSQRSRQSSQR